ncbi:MAG: OmpA family protein [Cyclobacteriaceae bacterium]|nr:OmpA family protein [Cyclobacteriaceae bacterium]MCB0499098.1 OmpA family protein [Cyclobacteriaceae bacterium]MCB9238374.1 OmpA family protein [Flammeovirgaceae bacterium]MCO5272056.1 OmpA family protein [Cyclobacteriaceae bacterium]MCW5902908.1 OmpA family protein [Cyclobacteriaceae bacterium]
MKKLSLLPCVIFVFMLAGMAYGQQQPSEGHYVVIGAFAVHNNAIRWTDKANKNNFNAQYAMNQARKLYYVYILKTDSRREAFAFMMKVRVETEYKDAWVFSGRLGIEPEEKPAPEPVVEETPGEQPESPVVEEAPVKVDSVQEEKPEAPIVEKEPEVEKPNGKAFMFRLVSNGEEVLGEVHVLESPRATQYQSFNGNEVVYLTPPRNPENAFIASVQAPGYRPVEITVDYNDPAVYSSGFGPQNEVVIPIELVRSKRGDYIEFNKVRFFGNSAIFQPESKIELDGLVDLMKENPKYKIKVHGHCNGKQSRNVVTKGNSNDFFATSTMNNRATVSAKELTQLRADLVKEYLVSQGIDAKRIKTKAEGGKVMIYPQTSTLAGYNDRIEVEIKRGK